VGPIERERQIKKIMQALNAAKGGTPAKHKERIALEAQLNQIIAKMSPDELAKPLIKRNQAGWANVSRQSRSMLVERGSGCIVMAPTGKREVAIVRQRREPTRFKTTLEINLYLNELVIFEDRIPHMYLDSRGNVTVGYGHLILDAMAATSLGFVDRATLTAVAKADVVTAFNKVKNSGLVNTRADVFKSLTSIDLPDPKIDALFVDDSKEFLRQLRHIFPDFDSFPQKAKWGLLDLIYNLGIVKFRGLFTQFQNAVKERNWRRAAAQSSRSETDPRTQKIVAGVVSRNAEVRRWFKDAAKQEPFFIKSQPRSCQVSWRDLMR
jgi:GH24 family phage-related lysozyme (muramidase)